MEAASPRWIPSEYPMWLIDRRVGGCMNGPESATRSTTHVRTGVSSQGVHKGTQGERNSGTQEVLVVKGAPPWYAGGTRGHARKLIPDGATAGTTLVGVGVGAGVGVSVGVAVPARTHAKRTARQDADASTRRVPPPVEPVRRGLPPVPCRASPL